MVTVNEIEVTQFGVTVDPNSEIITVNIGIGSAAGGSYTSTSFAADFNARDTDDLTEGSTNLYYTPERVDDQVAGLLVGGDNTTLTYNDVANTLTIDVASPPQLTTQDEGITAGTTVDTINFTGPGVTATDVGGVTTVSIPGTPVGDTDDLPEGATNLYYTAGRVSSVITTDVDKAFVDNLNVDADTLDGLDSTAFATAAQGTLADSALQSTDIGVTVQGYSLVLANTTASFTTLDETKLDNIAAGAQVNTVDSVNSQTGVVVLDADDISDAATANKFTTSADISKLAGIEAGATADQTAGEIKTAYESNTNTNAYTDAEQSKLAGIEAGATGDLSGLEIKSLYELNANTNVFTDAQESKLAGIEALADVTDSANVDAAGAVMNTDTSTAAMAFVIDEDTMATNSPTRVPTQQSVKNYVDNAVVGNLTYRGAYNAGSNLPDLDTAPTGVSIGDMYTVTTAGTFFTTPVEPGDALIAEVNNPVSEANWTIVQANLTPATIKTQYESNGDTNAYTDAEQTKLSGIETGATADQTASEILAALITVDGSSSNLDADLLDGQQGTYYLDYANFANTPTLYNSASFDADLSTKTTTDLTEGLNLYFTDERVDDRVANLLTAGDNITLTYNDVANTLTITGQPGYTSADFDTDFGTKTTTDLTEGSNLYYTEARANTAIDARVTASYINTLDITIDGGTF